MINDWWQFQQRLGSLEKWVETIAQESLMFRWRPEGDLASNLLNPSFGARRPPQGDGHFFWVRSSPSLQARLA
jgi:hypothetical protein